MRYLIQILEISRIAFESLESIDELENLFRISLICIFKTFQYSLSSEYRDGDSRLSFAIGII